MTKITEVVGESGENAPSDVIFVQAMLQALKTPEGKPYYDSRYDGKWGPTTRAAIAAFQRDHGLSEIDYGHVTRSSETLRRMTEQLPSDRRDMRVLPGTRIAYLAAEELWYSKGTASIGRVTFDQSFKTKVGALIIKMYDLHAVPLIVGSVGGYRDFQKQADVGSTYVGPGESYHNYGLAADVYFNTLRFIKPDGTLMYGGNEKWDKLKHIDYPAWLKFWETRDKIAHEHGLFPIGNDDRPHLQSDRGKSAGRSLVKLLNRRGTMKWDFRGGPPNLYGCDLGLGGKLVLVGKALEIWRGWANVSTSAIAGALGVNYSQVDSNLAQKLKQALREEFKWAENHWRDWKPI